MSLVFGRTKINSSDPPLTAVFAAYAPPPLLPFPHPPIELACWRPRGRLHPDRWIDFSAICFGTLLQLVVAGHTRAARFPAAPAAAEAARLFAPASSQRSLGMTPALPRGGTHTLTAFSLCVGHSVEIEWQMILKAERARHQRLNDLEERYWDWLELRTHR